MIRAESGALLIRTPVSVTAQVIALTGNVIRTVRLPAGDSRVEGLASGIYIVRLSNEITKKSDNPIGKVSRVRAAVIAALTKRGC